jgi:hypothetical protein
VEEPKKVAKKKPAAEPDDEEPGDKLAGILSEWDD